MFLLDVTGDPGALSEIRVWPRAGHADTQVRSVSEPWGAGVAVKVRAFVLSTSLPKCLGLVLLCVAQETTRPAPQEHPYVGVTGTGWAQGLAIQASGNQHTNLSSAFLHARKVPMKGRAERWENHTDCQ